MIKNKIKLSSPVIVEGKYDKIRLQSVIDAEIIVTNGFGIFKDDGKKQYIKRVAKKSGIIIVTDSDSAGMMIRNCLKEIIPPEKITNLYIPQIKGKERRKTVPSAEGTVGVEGIDTDTLFGIFAPLESDRRPSDITAGMLYEKGLSGCPDSKEKRKAVCRRLNLPDNLSSKEFLSAVNLLLTEESFEEITNEI